MVIKTEEQRAKIEEKWAKLQRPVRQQQVHQHKYDGTPRWRREKRKGIFLEVMAEN